MKDIVTPAQRRALEVLARLGFVVRVYGGFWIVPDFKPRDGWWNTTHRGRPRVSVLTLRAMERRGLVEQLDPGIYDSEKIAEANHWAWPWLLTMTGYAIHEGKVVD